MKSTPILFRNTASKNVYNILKKKIDIQKNCIKNLLKDFFNFPNLTIVVKMFSRIGHSFEKINSRPILLYIKMHTYCMFIYFKK